MKIRHKRYPKVERKYGSILGIKLSITNKERLLKDIELKLDSKEKFYIITPNPENLLIAKRDWLMRKAIDRCDFVIPDGIGLAAAYKFLELDEFKGDSLRVFKIFWQGLFIGYKILTDKKYLTDSLPIIKGRELALDILKIANDRHLNIYFFGGEYGESQRSIDKLKIVFPNINFKTNHQFSIYNNNCRPVSLRDRKIHKVVMGSIKMFEPHLIFVALSTPKQEKWIYRNLYRTKALGALALGGTYNFMSGDAKIAPNWMSKHGLEWLFRLFTEPRKEQKIRRMKRIFTSVIIFPWKVFMWKLYPPKWEISKK